MKEYRHTQTIVGALLILALIYTTTLPIVFADEFTSTNFTVSEPTFAAFGTADASSTNFQLTGTGGQIAAGEASSTSFTNESGFQYIDPYEPRTGNWRWYDDENNETPTSPLAGENVTPPLVDNASLLKLRVTANDLSGIAGEDIKFRLEFSEFSDFSQATSVVSEIGDCVGNSIWCYADGVDDDEDIISTTVLSSSTAPGTHNESGTTTSTFDPGGSEVTEYEFTLRQDGARVNTTYYFRLTIASTSEPVTLTEGASYPSVLTAGSELSFTITGLPTGTTTEGVVTDAATTPTLVPFGDLPFGTETEAAQRLSITTNATNGYQVFTFSRQGFLHTGYGTPIEPVTGTNSTPSTWGSGCPGSLNGCYGYHAGDDTLANGSTRFLADNTYAQFENNAREIAYSSTPVINEETDIVYKVEVRDQQQGGLYESSVVYIVTASF